MKPPLTEIRDQQKQSWDKFSSGWKKWDEHTMEFLHPMGDAIINRIRPSGNHHVLDIAAGTGEPGLTIASMIPEGRVTITDLSEQMLEIAADKASQRRLNNIEVKACDVCELPFPDNHFDSISCRFGFMFFPDMQLAATEMARVLKPGGRIATSVWNVPDKNFWITAIMGIIHKNIELPAPPPGSPGMFRCSQPGLVRDIFKNAGLSGVSETEIHSRMKSRSTEHYREMMNDIGAPIVSAMSKADESVRKKIKEEVMEEVSKKITGDEVVIDASALVISAQK